MRKIVKLINKLWGNKVELIKDYIKDNLELVIEFETKYSPGMNQIIGLKFKDEEEPFSTITVYVSEGE